MQPDAESRLRATRRSRRPSVIESIPRYEHECLAFPDRQSAYGRHQFWIRFLLFGVVDLPSGERRKALVECGLSPMSAPGVSDQIPRRHEQPGNGVLWYVLEASPGRQEGFRNYVLDVVKGGSPRDVSSDTRRMGLPEELEPSFSVVSQAEPLPSSYLYQLCPDDMYFPDAPNALHLGLSVVPGLPGAPHDFARRGTT